MLRVGIVVEMKCNSDYAASGPELWRHAMSRVLLSSKTHRHRVPSTVGFNR